MCESMGILYVISVINIEKMKNIEGLMSKYTAHR